VQSDGDSVTLAVRSLSLGGRRLVGIQHLKFPTAHGSLAVCNAVCALSAAYRMHGQ